MFQRLCLAFLFIAFSGGLPAGYLALQPQGSSGLVIALGEDEDDDEEDDEDVSLRLSRRPNPASPYRADAPFISSQRPLSRHRRHHSGHDRHRLHRGSVGGSRKPHTHSKIHSQGATKMPKIQRHSTHHRH